MAFFYPSFFSTLSINFFMLFSKVFSNLVMRQPRIQRVNPYKFLVMPTSMAGHQKCLIYLVVSNYCKRPEKVQKGTMMGRQTSSFMKQRREIQRQSAISSGFKVIFCAQCWQKTTAQTRRLLIGRLYATNYSLRTPINSSFLSLRPVYSSVSLTAVQTIVSPASFFPPGKQISPEYILPLFILWSRSNSVLRIASSWLILWDVAIFLRMMATALY